MRLFIAINFHEDTLARLVALRDGLRKRAAGAGRFSATENLHLTLAFLGECDERQAAAAKSAMDAAAFAPFGVAVERVGRFRREGGDIWWAGLRADKPLLALQKELSDKLTAKGFVLDDRRYSPHITLAREVTAEVGPWPVEPFGETVSGIDLMRSDRAAGKLQYTAIYRKMEGGS